MKLNPQKTSCVCIVLIMLLSCNTRAGLNKVIIEKPDHPVKYTGIRSSSYGVTPFPSEQKWHYAFDKMQSYFPESQSCGIWIIGNIENGGCALQFPKPKNDNNSYRNISFSLYDKHEDYLSYFDEKGIKVFLQVESGAADIETLIDLVMNQYGSHSSVIGFGVDLEWYAPEGQTGMNGETYFAALDDDTAMNWDKKVKDYNPDYRMFLKHWIWDKSIMPQNTASDIIFISDSQGFINYVTEDDNKEERALDEMILEFTNGHSDELDNDGWAENFRRNGNIRSVGYQIGYESDKRIWKDILEKPYPENLSNAILAHIPEEQEVSFFWVDFTMREVLLND